MVERLRGKVALVVGAGSIGPGCGNGKATAVAFAREGAKIFCADINPEAAEETAGIIRSEGAEAVAHPADVTKAADVIAMVEACASAYDRIDVLDNNVGIAEVGGVVEVSEDDWDRVFAVNLKSAYLTMKQVIPLMVGQGGGSIINISSIASIRYTGVPYATYYASKAALNQLTRTTAVEYASRWIRVNAILPGLMKTGSKADIEPPPVDVRFTPKANIAKCDRHVRFVPKADSCTAAKGTLIRSLRRRVQRIVFGCSPLLADALTGSGGVEMG